jgi:hypothetical protein
VHDIPPSRPSLEPFQDDLPERTENAPSGHTLTSLAEMHQSGAFRGSGGCGWCGRTADLVNPLSLAAEAAAIEHGHDRCRGEG